ncbi:universal stress protein [Methylorubrum extorquens]|uniref:universal stress protein n=1 Tax=Methylorubrum extorquens TaxID=408 RepID=UPI000158FBC2|nr:universal stress protein [Methylorubrum extorquens]ABY28906.1 UspA domain protein [Methylorubrum extorquens PA1]KQP94497.1 universal stress protein UspA [Methylobacterium sp. Leaf119]WIU40269.1 universal stress protein [Methylorubrum extorquens]
MTYASIMVSLDLGSGSGERTRVAAQLAEHFQARLIGVAAREMDYPRGYAETSVLGREATEEIRDAALADVAEVEAAFRLAVGSGRPIEWRSNLTDPEIFLEEQSRAADLVVLGRRGGQDLSDPRLAVNAGRALMGLGRPVLMVPPGVDHLSLKRVVVAWKNTLQTRRAISDAMPLLKVAQQVQVVRITTDEDNEDLEDVVRYLGLHGVNASAFRKSQNGASVALALEEAAKAFGASLIVSGAYGHNRLREWFFGGVTRALLNHCSVCCLMSH